MSPSADPQISSQDGQRLYQQGRYPQAADQFREAARAYSEAGDATSAAEMLNNCSVALLKAGQAAAAWEAAQGTDAVFAQAGDLHRQAFALGNQAAAQDALGNLKTALNLYQQSAELLKTCGDREARATVLESISVLQLRTGDHLPALASMDAALDQKKKLSLREKVLQALIKTPFRMLKR